MVFRRITHSRSHKTPSYAEDGLRPAPLTRYALLLTILWLSYLSLAPFSDWDIRGLAWWSWIFAPIPRYLTGFDIATNIIAYIPLGSLAVLVLRPHARGWLTGFLSLCLGIVLSAGLESLQMGLPQRIASNIDWLTNSMGTLFGILFTLPWAVDILRWRAVQNHVRWFTPTAPPLLALMLLWPWAQLYPVSHVFGVGDGLRAVLFEWAIPDDEDVLASPVFPWLDQVLDTLDNMAPTVTPGGWLAVLQLIVSTLSLWGMGSLAMLGMRRRAPQLRLLILGITLTLVLKALFNARLHAHFSSHWFDWEWLEARVWLSLGLAISGWLVLRWQTASVLRWFGSICLILALLASLLIPADPYAIGVAALQNGRLRYLHDLLRGLAWIWPMLAVFGFLNHPIHDPKRRIAPV
jgi:VanZ family protein